MSSPLHRALVVLPNAKGLHVRAATALSQTAGRFDAEVVVVHNGQRSSTKSVMNLLLLTAPHGAEVTVEARGREAEAAVQAICALIAAGFGE